MSFHDPKHVIINEELANKLFGQTFSDTAFTSTNPEDYSYESVPAEDVLEFDEHGWSEPLTMVPEIMDLLVDDDVVRLSRFDTEGHQWGVIKPFADNYLAFQLKRREEPVAENTALPNYYLLTEQDTAIPLGRFPNVDAAYQHAELAWSEREGYVVCAETMRRYMKMIEKHEGQTG